MCRMFTSIEKFAYESQLTMHQQFKKKLCSLPDAYSTFFIICIAPLFFRYKLVFIHVPNKNKQIVLTPRLDRKPQNRKKRECPEKLKFFRHL